MPKDRIVEKVRQARERYAARFGFDLARSIVIFASARPEVSSKWCTALHAGHVCRTSPSSRRARRPRAADGRRIAGMTHVRTSPYYPQSNGKGRRKPKEKITNTTKNGDLQTKGDGEV
jgi:hypothetical protein